MCFWYSDFKHFLQSECVDPIFCVSFLDALFLIFGRFDGFFPSWLFELRELLRVIVNAISPPELLHPYGRDTHTPRYFHCRQEVLLFFAYDPCDLDRIEFPIDVVPPASVPYPPRSYPIDQRVY